MAGTDDIFEYLEVAAGVFVAVAPPAPRVHSNAVIVDLGRRTLVFDTHASSTAASKVIGFIRGQLHSPVAYVVVSHQHLDHVGGIAAYRSAYPDAVVISHETTRAALFANVSAKQLGVASNDASTSSALSTTGELPELTVAQSLTLHGDDREAHVLHLGRAHTKGDLLVQLPAESVVVTGDVLIGWTPYMGDAFPLEWVDALRRLEELSPVTLLMGHGGPEERSWLVYVHRYLDALKVAARTTVEAGLPIDEASIEIRRALAPEYEEMFSRRGAGFRPWWALALANAQRTYEALASDAT